MERHEELFWQGRSKFVPSIILVYCTSKTDSIKIFADLDSSVILFTFRKGDCKSKRGWRIDDIVF